jgi:ABC-type polar amino acid transport system ATPase subunit
MEGADNRMSTVLSVADLRLRRGTRDVLRGVTFDVPRGEVVALMGLSGSGKTTVLRAVAGLEMFDAGTVQVNGSALTAGPSPPNDLRALRQHVGMVFQFHCLFEHLTALENVCLAPVHVLRRSRHDVIAQAQRLLDDLGVGGRAGALPRELSGGEAQRVAIARALAIDPPLLLLDEPTASLDPARRGDLGATLQTLAAAGRALLVACHDVTFVREFATSCAILADGVVVECGAPGSILDSPAHDATRALLKRG